MEHIHHKIKGWFFDSDIAVYNQMVDKFGDGDVFVEIGSFKGKSASAMAVNIANSNKKIKFYCVDTWQGSEEHQKNQSAEDEDVVNGTLYDVFMKNTEPVKEYITPLRKSSLDAAKDFEDGSLSFVFIDAAHDYENVKKDIEAWYPKVKKGGVLGGHDWFHQPIKQAVYEFCDKHNLTVKGNTSWVIETS